MSNATPTPGQRNALAPSLLAAMALFIGMALVGNEWFGVIRFIAAILGAIVVVYAAQARQWIWVVVFAAIVVIWNPVFPFEFSGPLWIAAQPVAALVFLVAGALIRTPPPRTA